MIEFTDREWDEICDEVDKTIIKAQDDLPEKIRKKSESIACIVDKYTQREGWKVLGCFIPFTNTIVIYAGQIYEDCRNITETMKSVRQVYYHELAHAIGDLSEHEVKERGL